MNSSIDEKSRKIELALPQFENEEEGEYVSKGKVTDMLKKLVPVKVNEIMDWFKEYQVDSIELSINGAIESEGILKLVVSAKGEGGVKVVLKPKASTTLGQ